MNANVTYAADLTATNVPVGAAEFRAYIGRVNNAIYIGRDSRGYVFRATEFAAKGVAKSGYDVTRVEGDTFTARRMAGEFYKG